MATTIEQQVALDEALVPSAQRLRIRNMLHICPRVQGQTFAELPFEKEILDFIRTMATTIEQQVVLDEALVPSVQRLRIG
nr:hypothetical protein [Tanacetum cinerariifolium]